MKAILLLGLAAAAFAGECPNGGCHYDAATTRLFNSTAPRLRVAGCGDKTYVLGAFFKVNWFNAALYCRFQGMQFAAITSQKEQNAVMQLIRDNGFGDEDFWISGFDLAKWGTYSWLGTGRPITYSNWCPGEPNHTSHNGEIEHCVYILATGGCATKWNDERCGLEMFFVCET